jgi:hypothetical protein
VTALILALVLMADGGTPRLDVKALVGEAMQGAQEEQRIAELKALAAKANPTERALLTRIIKLVESKEPFEKVMPQYLPLLKDATAYARGSLPEELALAGAYGSLPMTARSMRLDPAPYRAAALAYAKDLVARYPKEGRAHGVLASALLEAELDSELAREELKTCATLDRSSWCVAQYRQILADLERPRCSGATLQKPLTVWGATETSPKTQGALSINGMTLAVEAKPILESSAFSLVRVDPDGSLSLETTKADAVTLARETKRLLGKYFVLKLGDDVLLAGMLQSEIAEGRLRVTPGQGKPPFKLEALCATIERPKVPEAMRLK